MIKLMKKDESFWNTMFLSRLSSSEFREQNWILKKFKGYVLEFLLFRKYLLWLITMSLQERENDSQLVKLRSVLTRRKAPYEAAFF